jgi:serine/threonine-protein kinase
MTAIAHDVIHLLAFENRLRERERDGGFGDGIDPRQDLHPHVAAHRARHAGEILVAAAVEHPRPYRRRQARSTRVRCSPSSRGNATVSSPESSAGAKNRCTAECYTRARMFFRGQIIGKYKILSTIGSGGFGTVYLAEDTWIDKKVALKVPHKQGVDFGELLREPRLLASLNHPNIVTILTAEKQENVFFIVMEFVPGETLEAIIATDGPLDVARALDYTCQICNAVDHAHRQSVLHRDPAAPSNVLVDRQRPAEGGRLRDVALSSRSRRTGRRSSAARRTWRRAVPGQRRCSRPTSIRSA